ncbi:hypothetical protein BV25DRAFT_1841813 [Artomyces pyxidatus]|uniref:Uncharacterized protein n=1 Tax=Artomyces pyxidatus TaxID=48021 RepID=A0ACB8SLU6_9AGAM|nr:hypothetical protein BV25DRAFT_1841813 [Artomyces pyxidatus]
MRHSLTGTSRADVWAAAVQDEQARRVSAAIDEDIQKHRGQTKQTQRAIRMLVVGQTGSGKSTVVKQWQLWCEPTAFEAETVAWRPVIYLNLIQYMLNILNVVSGQYTKRSQNIDFLGSVQTGSVSETLSEAGYVFYPEQLAPLRELRCRLISMLVNSGDEHQYFEDASTLVGDSSVCDSSCRWSSYGRDPWVRDSLEESRVTLQQRGGFFLDDIKRVTATDYVPTTGDHYVRLKTAGLREQVFKNKPTWRIYDIKSARAQRQTWIPFFDTSGWLSTSATSLVFVAPISNFDEVLEEVKDYIPEFGDGPCNFDAVTHYFRRRFLLIQKAFSPYPQDSDVYTFFTTTKDTTQFKSVLSAVRDLIMEHRIRPFILLW